MPGNDELGLPHRVRGGNGTTHPARIRGAALSPVALCGKRISQAVIWAALASCSPAAIAWPASPKPMKAILGLPLAMHSSRRFGYGAVVAARYSHLCHK
jgi:hypothetical protein